MKQISSRAVSFFLGILLIAGCLSQSVYGAKSISDLQKEKDALKNEKSDLKNSLTNIQSQKSAAQQELDEYNEKLIKINEELIVIEGQVEEATAELEKNQAELEEAEAAKADQQELFKQRARYIYMNGSLSYFDVIINSENFGDLMKKIDYVNRIVGYDLNLVSKMEETENLIAVKTEEAQAKKDQLVALEIVQTGKKLSYEDIVSQKDAAIKALYENESEYLKLIEENEKEDKEIEKLIAAAQEEQRRQRAASSSSPAYEYDGGTMQWPVPSGRGVSSGYGTRTLFGRKEFHTGLDIPASYGQNVLAAEAGTVIYASWMNGFGNTIMIDHGGGVTTLYGHNSSLTVKKGQTVTRGQVVAKIGSTGFSTGNHCHFEVRVGGKHTDPNKYVKRP